MSAAAATPRPPPPLPADVVERITQFAAFPAPVLITGETGTGKSTVAREIHRRSARSGKIFVKVDCSTLTSTLARGELFGNVRGAWTGADTARRGLILKADGGTLFLDEIGILSIEDQSMLLSVIQERTVRPVGGSQDIEVDARIIVATNEDLDSLVTEGRFRQDLYYRCCVLQLHMPPLRDRREEFRDIITFLLHDIVIVELGMTEEAIPHVSPAALASFRTYNFPGNLRELRSMLYWTVSIGKTRIEPKDLPAKLHAATTKAGASGPPSAKNTPANSPNRYRAPLDEAVERRDIVEALREAQSARAAARLLGMSKSLVYGRIKRHKIREEEWKRGERKEG